MIILPVTHTLSQANVGLNSPALNALIPDANNYSVLLLQPRGRIDATPTGIRNHDEGLAREQFGTFLEEAAASQPDLVVTPEYAMPWSVLRTAINDSNKWPAPGKLWALGCESIKYSDLQALQRQLARVATVLFEELVADNNKFVDPLTYVFRTMPNGACGESRLVLLIQFKTHMMADPQHDFERNQLQLGTVVYQFGDYHAGPSLTSLICSDVFAFTDDVANKVYDRALILHIQLNSEPRHQKFLEFRGKLLGITGFETEILSLNWASGVGIWIDGQQTPLRTFAGSAWYVKVQEFDSADATLGMNHRRGMYYTWLAPHRTHVLFFNFNPATFSLTASKVARTGVPAAVGTRRGPQLNIAKRWDESNSTWRNDRPADDGFSGSLNYCGDAAAQVRAMFEVCPLACERLLALCAGNADQRPEWHDPCELDSFRLDQTERIFRMTFCQETERDVPEFRIRRLTRCAALWNILVTPEHLPLSLKNISEGFTLEWTRTAPHQNLRSHAGDRSTVMYLSDESDNATIERTYANARERVRCSLSEEEGDRAKQRVGVWYRDNRGSLRCRWDTPTIDRRRGESEHDIGRES